MTRRTLIGVPLALVFGNPLAAPARGQQPNLNALPPNLPRPNDDGGARHLPGMALPDLDLPAIGIAAASAQTDDTARPRLQVMAGVVKAVSVSSLTLASAGKEVVFVVGQSTRLLGKGSGPRDLVYRWPRKKLPDLVNAGDRVTVTYRRSGARLNAVDVRIDSRK